MQEKTAYITILLENPDEKKAYIAVLLENPGKKVYIAILLENPGKESLHCYLTRESRKRKVTLLSCLRIQEKTACITIVQENARKENLH